MASYKSVVVLAPNGRRQTVKVSPNTTIMQILEQVCKKQGFEVKEFDIKHHNKVLDTSTSIQFSGLPNNAQLELTPATKTRAESDVYIALNLESGGRLMGTFNPDATLLAIANQLCPSEADLEQNPVIIFMRNEIYGEGLKTTTLRSLGITSGRAMLRLIHKKPEELQNQTVVGAPLPPKPAEEQPYVRKLQKMDAPETAKPDSFGKSSNDSHSQGVEPKRASDPPTKNINQLLDVLKKEKRLKPDSFSSKGHVLKESQPEPMEVDVATKENPAQDVVVEKQTAEESEDTLDDFVFLGDRNAMVFSLETAESLPASDLPDDFFELTIDDAKKILRDIRRKRNEMENAQLTTSAYRNLEEAKKQLRLLHRYNQAVIRIHFPDRTVLQGVFKPKDTVADIVNFVRLYLEEPSMDFYLYTTPPKSVLNHNSMLMEVGFVPGALIHFGTDSKSEDNNYLKKNLTEKFTTTSIASLAATKLRKSGTRDVKLDSESVDVESAPSTSTDTNIAPASENRSYEDYPKRSPNVPTTEKVPKWFKPL